MKSYKCEYCNLKNWTDTVVCKRCQMPNPYLPEHSAINENQYAQESFDVGQHQENELPQMAPPPSYYSASRSDQDLQIHPHNLDYADESQDSPPNLYGESARGFEGNMNSNHTMPDQNSVSAEDRELWRKSLKQIKTAWTAGLIWSILLVVGSLMIFGLSSDVSTDAPDEVNAAISASVLFMFVLTGLVSALCYGVYKKSQFCAVVITVMLIFGLISNLTSSEGSVGIVTIGFSLLYIYFFVNGVVGISNYKKLKARHPNLNE